MFSPKWKNGFCSMFLRTHTNNYFLFRWEILNVEDCACRGAIIINVIRAYKNPLLRQKVVVSVTSFFYNSRFDFPWFEEYHILFKEPTEI